MEAGGVSSGWPRSESPSAGESPAFDRFPFPPPPRLNESPAASSSPSRRSSDISAPAGLETDAEKRRGLELVSDARRPARPDAGERPRVRRAHPRPDAGDEVRPRDSALERRDVEAESGKSSLAVAHALEVVPVERRADRADQRTPEAEPIHGPAFVVVEPADLSLDALRHERRGQGPARPRRQQDQRHAAHRCSRTGRPVRRSTRYASPGRQAFESRARRVVSFTISGGCRYRAAAPARACRSGGSRWRGQHTRRRHPSLSAPA